MLRKKCVWFSALAVAFLLIGGEAFAFKSGNWNGEANNDDNGKFRDCTMLAEYNSGITLAFIITRDFDWGLVLANDKWNLETGSTQNVTLAVDQRSPIAGTAKAVDAKGLLISLENNGPVVDAMRQSMYGGDPARAAADGLVLLTWLVGGLSAAALGVTRMTHYRTLRDLQPSLIG